LLILHVFNTGIVAATKKHMWGHAVLEIPVLLASALALALSDAPLTDEAQLSHVVSIAATVLLLFFSVAVFYCIAPYYRARHDRRVHGGVQRTATPPAAMAASGHSDMPQGELGAAA
jgi:hypothetical protein